MKYRNLLLPSLSFLGILAVASFLASGCANPKHAPELDSIPDRYSTVIVDDEPAPPPPAGKASDEFGEDEEEEISAAEPEDGIDAAEEPSPTAPEPATLSKPAATKDAPISTGGPRTERRKKAASPSPPKEEPLADRLASVIQARAKQRFGNAAYLFDVPKEMNPHESSESTLTLALGKVAEDLQKSVNTSGVVTSGEIKGITLTLDAKLTGAGITTKPIGRSEQSLDDQGKAHWSWLLTSEAVEEYKVFLSVSAVYVSEGSGHKEYVLIHEEERSIAAVKVPLAGTESATTTQAGASQSWWGKLVGGGVSEAFKWVWLTLLLPPLKLFWNRHQGPLEKKSRILARLFNFLRRLTPSRGGTSGK